MRERSDKLDFIKIKNFFSAKDTIKTMRKQAQTGRKIFPKDITNK